MIVIEAERHFDFVRCVGINYMRVYDVPHTTVNQNEQRTIKWNSGCCLNNLNNVNLICVSCDHMWRLIHYSRDNSLYYCFDASGKFEFHVRMIP